jgi:hypothetical protein
MLLSPGWTFLALLPFFNTARSYVFENATIEADMLQANLVGRAEAAPHGSQEMQAHDIHRHIVAIGDVHGKIKGLKKVLYMAGVTDKVGGKWGKSEPTDVREK